MIRHPLLPIALALGVLVLASGCGHVPLAGGGSEPHRADMDFVTLEARATAEPTQPHWPFLIGEKHARAGHPIEAEAALHDALARDPHHAPSLSLLSKIHWDAGRHEEAVQLLEGARASGSVRSELLVALALHYEALEEFDRSQEILRVAPAGLSVKAWVQLRGDDFESSAAVAERALQANDRSAVNQNNWAITRLYAGRPEEARKAFLTAVDLDPRLPGPLYNLAIVDRFYRFDEVAAQDWFRRYLELSNDDPDGLAEILSVKVASESSANAGEGTN